MNTKKLIKEMTIQEKASLLSGLDFWHTKAVARLDIPQIMVSDGPHGLRTQNVEANGNLVTRKATCYPSASALSCSWDRDLAEKIGNAIGNEALEFGVDIVLGPGINIKRSPLCGRNFEYYSEDPVLAGEMAAGFINGVQETGVGTCVKHFAVNNQEYRRLSVDACLSKKALMDIYLKNFEIAIKKAKPYSVMCSYNKINGEYACQSKELLTDILRDLWGFDGIVMSDWGATNDRIDCLKAGMELEMPSSGGINDEKVAKAVESNILDEKYLDLAVERLLRLIDKCLKNRKPGFKADFEKNHEIALKGAMESAVLLKNQGALPVKSDEKIAVIGEFAKVTRYQGGGSSHINATKVENALDHISKLHGNVVYSQGYRINDPNPNDKMIAQAVEVSKDCDKIIVFAGLPDSFESEGYDRKSLDIPSCQNALIEALIHTDKDVCVILYNGAPVVMPWLDNVNAVMTCYLAGQAVGAAAARLILGYASPCGKLSETYPACIEDTPAYLSFPGYMDSSIYGEDVFVGYRYYDKKQIKPLFPFGYGLSYTAFSYSDFAITTDIMRENEKVQISFTLKNSGEFDGKEIVQLYCGWMDAPYMAPSKELKVFKKVALKAKQSERVMLELGFDDLASFNTADGKTITHPGRYNIFVGISSDDIKYQTQINIISGFKEKYVFHHNSTISDLVANPTGKQIFDRLIAENPEVVDMVFNGMDDDGSAFKQEMINNTTLRSLVYFSQGKFSWDMLEEIITTLNSTEHYNELA